MKNRDDFLVVNLLEAKLGGDALLQKAQRRLLEARRKVKMRQQNRLPLDLVLAQHAFAEVRDLPVGKPVDIDHRAPESGHLGERLGESPRIGRRVADQKDKGTAAAAQGSKSASRHRLVMRRAFQIIYSRPSRQEGSGGRITGDADYLALRARKIGWRTCINGSSPCRSAGTRRAPLGNACWPRSKPADYTTNGGGERDIAPSAVLPSALGAALVALEKIARITARFTEPLPFCRRSS